MFRCAQSPVLFFRASLPISIAYWLCFNTVFVISRRVPSPFGVWVSDPAFGLFGLVSLARRIHMLHGTALSDDGFPSAAAAPVTASQPRCPVRASVATIPHPRQAALQATAFSPTRLHEDDPARRCSPPAPSCKRSLPLTTAGNPPAADQSDLWKGGIPDGDELHGEARPSHRGGRQQEPCDTAGSERHAPLRPRARARRSSTKGPRRENPCLASL